MTSDPDAHDGRSSFTLDTTSVKVLAHPLRSRLMAALRRDGPATATDLAGSLGTNTGATSYHLRRLAEVGLVVDTGEGEGRRRLWRASADVTSWTPSRLAADEDARTALGWLNREHTRRHTERYYRWLDAADDWPPEWQDALGSGDDAVTVTAEQMAELAGELWALIQRYRTAGEGDPAARRVSVVYQAAPLENQEPPG